MTLMNDVPGAAYLLPPEEGGRVRDALAEHFQTVAEDSSPHAAASGTVTYYDTFDWRVHAAGGTLSTEPGPGGATLLVRRDADGEVVHRLPFDGTPGFAADLPEGPLRRELEPVLEMRRLLPVVELRRDAHTLRVLDDEEKTVVRLSFEERAAGHPETGVEPRPLPPVVRVRPVRGYPEARHRAVELLAGELGLEPAEEGELAEVLAALGRRPGDYSSKVRVELDPSAPAAEAAKAIHRHLFATLRANEDGTRRDLDSEFLHDFRVAVRRTRSALTQVKKVFPPPTVEHFRREFSWLGKLTGPTRDLDVYLLKIGDHQRRLPEATREELAPLHDFLESHQRHEQRKLVAGLDSERYRRLLADWESFLERPAELDADGAPNAGRPALEVASERIHKVYRRVLKRGGRIDDDTPAEHLHRLRIDCKKLRYLMELFRGLYEPSAVGRLIKALKKLQDNLGDFNDYEVQQEHLRDFGRRMLEEGEVGAETLMAMGRLVAELEEGQAEERRRFGRRFARFADKENRRRFRELFASG